MTYRTNAQIENPTQEDQNLKHIRELCAAKLASNDDGNALQLARDVLAKLPQPAPAFVDPPTTPPSATGR